MTKPINIYALSRIRNEIPFNIVQRHHSEKDEMLRTQYHEIESLRLLADALIDNDVSVKDLDGFFYAYSIPQIGKEFDLLKFTEKLCLNIELKSDEVPKEQILNQLLKNQYYLSHLGKRILLYTVITKSMKCYKLSLSKELVCARISEIADAVKRTGNEYSETIDNMFRASDYLVSPVNTPDRFIQGEYFLTQAQEQIKKKVLDSIDNAFRFTFIHIDGRSGTGKTLLLYDIAKTLSKNGKTLIVHCGKLSAGQYKISAGLENLNIISSGQLTDGNFTLSDYNYILVDESHRIGVEYFDLICATVKRNEQVCIFSSDPEQILSATEQKNDIAGRIRELPLCGEYTLSEKIRTNRELNSFIHSIKNLSHKPEAHLKFYNVQLNYANTTQEAQNLLEYYKAKGYTFINYTKTRYEPCPYSAYCDDFDTVIAQEFDKVVMLMDNSFYYDENGILQGLPHPNPDYLYPNLFYQGITRVREKLALIVAGDPVLFEKIVSIVKPAE